MNTLNPLSNKSGAVQVQGQHFLLFGEEMPVEAGLNTRKFTGHERDAETGLDYMLARYYQAPLGRFLSPDPAWRGTVTRPQSWNRYTYAYNNPVAYIDMSGLLPRKSHIATSERVQLARGVLPPAAHAFGLGVANVDRGFTSNPILSPELHFGGKPTLNHLINCAIDAYAAGDSALGDEIRKEAHHLAEDMHGHQNTNVIKHFFQKLMGKLQEMFGKPNTADPDSKDSPGFAEREAAGEAEAAETGGKIDAGERQPDATSETSGDDAHFIYVYGSQQYTPNWPQIVCHDGVCPP